MHSTSIRNQKHPESQNRQVGQKKTIVKGRIWTQILDLKDVCIKQTVQIAKLIKWFLSLVGTVLENMLPSKKWSHEIYSFTTKEDNPDLFEDPDEKKHTLTLGGMPAFRTAKDDTQYISMLEPYEQKFIRQEVLDKTNPHATPDFEKVPADVIENAVRAVRDGLERGNVYLHCKAGYGRSAVVAVCYMMSVLKNDKNTEGKSKYRITQDTNVDHPDKVRNFKYDTEKLYKAAYEYVKGKRPQIYTKDRHEEAKEWFRTYENEHRLS